MLVIVPNAWNYGQPGHWLYHRVAGRPCDFVGPRRWLAVGPVAAALESHGMEIVQRGLIDVPWWPGFPELPAMVRRVLKPWAPPHQPDTNDLSVDGPELAALLGKAERATFIERSRLPLWLRTPFAHNLYVLARHP